MIIVSGATGFLGAHVVCHLLQQGKQVRALKRESSSLDEFHYIFSFFFRNEPAAHKEKLVQQLEWFPADILDIPQLEKAFSGIKTVYHCAATVSFLQKDRTHMMQVNVEGTANMVNLSLQQKVEHFCHVSSIAALGREKSGIEASEETRWSRSKLNTNYAVSKYRAEMEVWRGIEEGLPAVIVNPGVILGVGDWNKGSCKLFELPWKNFPFYTTGVNGYVDVMDVARAMVLLTEKRETYAQRYILVGANMNMEYFMHTVATMMDKQKAKFKVNLWMAEIAWRLFALQSVLTGKAASITKETSRASLNQYFYSSKKIEDRIGFSFTPIDETLAYISEQFKQEHIQ